MNRIALIIIILSIMFVSCEQKPIPKPRGYFRIDLPERSYLKYESECPYTFEYPVYSKVFPHISPLSKPYWIDIVFPGFKAEINVSYYPKGDTAMSTYFNDSRNFAYKHTIKADAINEEVFINNEKRVYGSWYEIKGNAASPYQFYLTDSTDHFFRGALYFSVKPNKDSLAPVIAFLKDDIKHLIETFEWKE